MGRRRIHEPPLSHRRARGMCLLGKLNFPQCQMRCTRPMGDRNVVRYREEMNPGDKYHFAVLGTHTPADGVEHGYVTLKEDVRLLSV